VRLRELTGSPLIYSIISTRKEAIGPGITDDMKKCQCCSPMDMVLYFLARCCEDNLPDTHRNDQALHECFGKCWRKVVTVANSGKMKKKLKD
jgi:hypothetical protein